MKKHSTTLVTYKNMQAEIDEELAPMILTLWQNDIETIFCCQHDMVDNPYDDGRSMDVAYIQFDGDISANKFLTFAINKFKKLNILYDDESNPYPLFHWIYEMYPGWDDENKCTFLTHTVHFPSFHIEAITKVFNEELLSKKELDMLDIF